MGRLAAMKNSESFCEFPWRKGGATLRNFSDWYCVRFRSVHAAFRQISFLKFREFHYFSKQPFCSHSRSLLRFSCHIPQFQGLSAGCERILIPRIDHRRWATSTKLANSARYRFVFSNQWKTISLVAILISYAFGWIS